MNDKRYPPPDVRGSLVELVAGTLESLARQRSTLRRAEDDDDLPGHAPQQGDFLYDFMRLNVQYVNQLARLGSNYSIIAARALERVYDHFQPLAADEGPGLIRLEGIEDDRVVVRVPVENHTDEDARYTVSTTEFKVEDESKGLFDELKPTYQHPKRSRQRSISFELEQSERQEVRLGLVLTKHLVLGAEYRGQVVVTRAKSQSGDYDREIVKHPISLRRIRG